MWNVLQIRDPTKRKRAGYTNETIDYFLNRIYSPYFNISYRDQRKIEISNKILKGLLSGNIDTARNSKQEYLKGKFKEKTNNDDSQLNFVFEDLM